MASRASNLFRRHLAGKSRNVQVAILGSGVTLTAFGVAVTAAALTEWKAEHGSKTDENAQILPRCYDLEEIHAYWSHRPISAAKRMIQVSTELFPLAACVLYDAKVSKRLLENHHDSHKLSGKDLQKWYAQELRKRLTTLGPAFVKMGQQLSIRPDLIPAVVIGELNKLCDSVDPVPDDIAFQVMEREFQRTPNEMFDDLKLVASASLGQVYKAKIKESGEWVAIKVQRPDMLRSVSLDLYLLHHFAVAYDAIVTKLTHQSAYHVGLVDAFAKGSYQELDYKNEAANQIRFATEFLRRKCPVHVPKVYLDYTTRCVLTSEWIDGIKLSDAPNDVIKSLIPVGVELFLTQLLDIGTFHADPHPGNLCVRNHNQLVLLDFGLCATIDEQSRMAMTAAIVHLLAGDFDTLVSVDAKRKIVVCSDGMARGMDIPAIVSVINYDIPGFAKTYVHRCGRTARAGRQGKATSILQAGGRDVASFRKFRKLIHNFDQVKPRGIRKDLAKDAVHQYPKCVQKLQDVIEMEQNWKLNPIAPLGDDWFIDEDEESKASKSDSGR